MICVPLTGKTVEEMLRDAHRAAKAGADLVEFRVDCMEKPEVDALVAKAPVPEIITCRPRREGGNFAGEESARLAVLQKAIDLGADYIDVELDSVAHVHPEWHGKLIVSVHDFERTPDDLPRLHKRIADTGADVVKIATTARDISDNLRIFDLLDSVAEPTIALAMGECGVISRILSRKFGGWLTFASLERGKESAEGQITVDELLKLYRFRDIRHDTEIFGVVANPVAHSMSPLIHNAAFAHLGMNCVYVPMLVDDVTGFLARFRALAKGFSVTLPHKERAMDSADEIDPLTKRIGALNTLVVKDGKLIGANTDLPAAIGAMEQALGADPCATSPTESMMPRPSRYHASGAHGEEGASPLRGKRVAVIGARGTARAIILGLVDAGAEVKIYNRTVERARLLAEEFGASWAGLDALAEIKSADVLVNTTPVGMWPKVDASPVPADVLHKGMLVFDAVYNPLETRLLREARERGCLCVSGLEMFVLQAAEQFRLFTGQEPPVDVMRDAVTRRLTGGG
jgi:3-dehydroquinate dehydratase/shikimate dehydrogenase